MAEAVAARAGAWLLTYLLHSTAALLVAWALTRLPAARDPVLSELVWKAAVLAGVVTATAAVTPGTAGLRVPAGPGEWVGEEALGLEAPPPAAPLAREAGQMEVREVRMVRVRAVWGVPGWRRGLLLLWMAGGGLALALEVRRHRTLGRIRASLRPAGEETEGVVARLATGAGVAPVQVGRSPQVEAPCVVGSGTIALPVRCEDALTPAELEVVLAHEVAHVARRDPGWRAGLRWLSAFLWIQPLNRLAMAELERCAEHVCDDWAVARTGRSLELARSIERVVEWAQGPGGDVAVVGVARARGPALVERVRRILSGAPAPAASRSRRVLFGLAVVAPFLFLPSIPGPEVARAAVFVERTEAGSGDAEVRVVVRKAEVRDPSGP